MCKSGHHISEIIQRISETGKVEREDALRNVTRIIEDYQKYVMASEDKLQRVEPFLKFRKP